MKGIDQIRKFSPEIARRIMNDGGFLRSTDVVTLATADNTKNIMVLVRCNNGRFTTPMQNVMHFTKMIEQHHQMMKASGQEPLMVSDYVRDISLLAG